MHKFLLPLFILTGVMVVNSSCRMNVLKGEGAKGASNPTVSAFDAVDLDIPVKATIMLQEGSQPGIQLNGYNNIISHLKTKVTDNKLTIYSDLDETWDVDYDDLTVQITLPSMKSLSLSGAPDAVIHGNITGNEFKLDISGSSKVAIDNLNTDNFSSGISGAGDIEIKGGTVKNATYEVSGAGKIKAFPLQTTETTVSISGAGKGEVTAGQKLSVSVSGAGSVKYKGHPSVTQDISGAGSVTAVN